MNRFPSFLLAAALLLPGLALAQDAGRAAQDARALGKLQSLQAAVAPGKQIFMARQLKLTPEEALPPDPRSGAASAPRCGRPAPLRARRKRRLRPELTHPEAPCRSAFRRESFAPGSSVGGPSGPTAPASSAATHDLRGWRRRAFAPTDAP